MTSVLIYDIVVHCIPFPSILGQAKNCLYKKHVLFSVKHAQPFSELCLIVNLRCLILQLDPFRKGARRETWHQP